jgi:hypothetical protein
MSCERCLAPAVSRPAARCARCCRDLCARCEAEPSCPNAASGRHEREAALAYDDESPVPRLLGARRLTSP